MKTFDELRTISFNDFLNFSCHFVVFSLLPEQGQPTAADANLPEVL